MNQNRKKCVLLSFALVSLDVLCHGKWVMNMVPLSDASHIVLRFVSPKAGFLTVTSGQLVPFLGGLKGNHQQQFEPSACNHFSRGLGGFFPVEEIPQLTHSQVVSPFFQGKLPHSFQASFFLENHQTPWGNGDRFFERNDGWKEWTRNQPLEFSTGVSSNWDLVHPHWAAADHPLRKDPLASCLSIWSQGCL